MSLPHRVVIAAFPDVDLLDVTGPAEVFALANRQTAGRAGYQVRLAGPGAARYGPRRVYDCWPIWPSPRSAGRWTPCWCPARST